MSSYAASTASTASLVSHQPTRDYSVAFGTLASSYGASGAAPCRSSSKTTSHSNSEPSSSSDEKRWRSFLQRSSSSTSSSSMSRSEEYAVPKSQDFGALMDKYGAASTGLAHGLL